MPKSRASLNIHCMLCPVSQLCLPGHLEVNEIEQINTVIQKIKFVAKGEHIFHAEEPMHNLYAVRSGSCKDYWLDENGNERIDNFYFPGDIVGIESIPQQKHIYSLSALEDSQLCIIPLEGLYELMQKSEHVLKRIMTIVGYKMQNDRHVHITTNANQRVADFILNILYRLQEREGYHQQLILPMSQLDISNYLGMAHETVNRVLRKFHREKIINIENKNIHILDEECLQCIGTPVPYLGQREEILVEG